MPSAVGQKVSQHGASVFTMHRDPIIAFDGDDTLWSTEELYERARVRIHRRCPSVWTGTTGSASSGSWTVPVWRAVEMSSLLADVNPRCPWSQARADTS